MIKNLNKKHFAAGFVLGFIIAFAISGIAIKTALKRHHDPSGHKVRMVKKIKKVLKLDPAQTEKVTAIIDLRFDEMRKVHKNTRKEHERLHGLARAEIRALLNGEQLERFDKFIKAVDKRRARWKKRNQK